MQGSVPCCLEELSVYCIFDLSRITNLGELTLTLRLLCRGHSFDLCWELLVLVMGAVSDRTNASCGCVPRICQIAEVTTTKDEKELVSGNVLR